MTLSSMESRTKKKLQMFIRRAQAIWGQHGDELMKAYGSADPEFKDAIMFMYDMTKKETAPPSESAVEEKRVTGS